MPHPLDDRPGMGSRVARGCARRVAVRLAALVAAAVAGPAGAQVSPNGPQFQVNTYTTGWQRAPAVAVDGKGNFVVAWDSLGSSGTDTSASSIQAQRYEPNGASLGGECQVNTHTTSWQYYSAVAVDGKGNLVVAWTSFGSSGTDTSAHSIQAQRYDANGAPVGGQFQVNTYTTSTQWLPALAVDGKGHFVVAWESYGSSGTDTSAQSIQAQRYDADGIPLGGQFQVNTYTTSYQSEPAVSADGQGNFVVAWASRGSSGTDTSLWSIQAQRFGADGAPLGGQFQINTYTTFRQRAPAVGVDTKGNFVVAWQGDVSSDTDTDSYSIQAQRYDRNGASAGGEFQVNTYTTSYQRTPAVAVDGQGRFVVAWTSYGSSGTDTSYGSIQAQRYDASGAPFGGELQVNAYTTSRQRNPAVAVDGQGNFVIAWTSYGSSGTDTSDGSIQAQRYDALFRDGVESGDTARWSATIP